MISSELKNAIKNVKCVSFDIFDTSLLRPYSSPDDLFYHIEEMYGYKGYAIARKQAEQDAWDKYRTESKEDITLDEIYSRIATKYKVCQKIEEEMEYKTSLQNPEIYEMYLYAIEQEKKVIFTSDMYLPQEDIIKMLHKADYRKYERIFVSNKYGKLKNTGSLYQVVLDTMNISPDEILHIGDNRYSDIDVAQRYGVRTYFYPSVLQQYLKSNSRVRYFLKKYSHNVTASMIVMLSAINYVKNKDQDYWVNFGYEYNGPLCTGFLLWIQKNLSRKIKDIIFVARDGYTLKKVFDEIFADKYQTYYIYAPRSLNLICQLNYEKSGEFTLEHTKTLIDYYRNKSSILHNAPEILSSEQGVRYIEENRHEFEKLAKKEKKNYEEYLRSQNIKASNIALVDTVSMFFSAQKFISSILPKSKIEGFYYLIQEGAKIQQNMHSYKDISHYAPDLSLVEFMMTSPENPILDVEKNKPVYKKDVSEYEKERQIVCEKMSQGALMFCSMLKNSFDFSKLMFDVSVLTEWVNNLVEHPTAEDKKRFLTVLCAYDPQHQDYRAVFPEWYTRRERVTATSLKITKKVKFSILGIPFYKEQVPQQYKWKLWKITLVTMKEKRGVLRYKLLDILPILKIRKIYF